MIDLANSSNAATNDVDGRMQVTKPGANVNAVLRWKQAQKVSVAQKFLRFLSQDFQIRCNCTFVDQIHILFHDMLCEKNPLTIWFPPTFDPCQIRIKVILIQTSSYFFKHFTLLITSSLFKRCCFGRIFFQKSKDSIGVCYYCKVMSYCQNLQKQPSTGAQKAFK